MTVHFFKRLLGGNFFKFCLFIGMLIGQTCRKMQLLLLLFHFSSSFVSQATKFTSSDKFSIGVNLSTKSFLYERFDVCPINHR